MKRILLICGIVSLFLLKCWSVFATGQVEVRPYNVAPITDAVGLRYSGRVETNSGTVLKIIFGSTRVCGTGNPYTYLVEKNVYSPGLRYIDPVCVFWPMQGTNKPGESSLRFGIPDYNKLNKFGVKTYSPSFLPRQTYDPVDNTLHKNNTNYPQIKIDGLPGLWKIDSITQANMNSITSTIELTRGGIVTDKTGWKCGGVNLDSDTYRRWNIKLTIGSSIYNCAACFPDSSASLISANEILALYTEFLNTTGAFKVYFWNFEIKRNGQTIWEPLNTWKVIRYDGNGSNYGVKVTPYSGFNAIEISNTGGSYLPIGFVFSL